MTLINLDKAPFPWFGGKSKAADVVWQALGDVCHYVEPFFGSGAVLLKRPHQPNRPYFSETVNDADGLLVNLWRSIQLSPDATAQAASWPVSEADVHARHCALLKWREEHQLEHLMGDPTWHDPVMAGWWVWGQCSWIGAGWCSGTGPWSPDETGRLRKRPRGSGGGGKGEGVSRKLPHVSNDGRGVNRPGTREPGVYRKIPHLTNGRGINRPGTRKPGVYGDDYHPLTMPELKRWFAYLSARLRHVRILNGDWIRAATPGAAKHIGVRKGTTPAGIFLDPPYVADARASDLYAVDCGHVANDVRDWCLEHGPDPEFRIVLAGFSGGGHEALEGHGWRAVEWFTKGHLHGGYANQSKDGTNQRRERLWLSPHCLTVESERPSPQLDLWGSAKAKAEVRS